MDKLIILKLIKFCVVGASGMAVDFGFTGLLKEKFKANKYLSNSVGFILAASSNYVLNRIWTFESQNSAIVTEYFSFLIISLIGLGFNNFFLYLLHEKGNLNFYLSKLISIGIVTLWNFGMNYLFTFK